MGQAKLARLMDWRKSSPFISMGMHISARRERMRSPMRSPRVCSRAARWIGIGDAAGRLVSVVGGDDGGLAVVVAGVEDEGDRVPDPLVGLLRAQVVEDQDFSVKNRLEQFELGGGHLRVVAVLDVLEQLAVVGEEPFDAALADQAAKDADGEMRFAHADGAGEEQAFAGGVYRVCLDKFAGVLVSAGDGGVGLVQDV